MALNEIDDVYGTQDQVEFARRMAESLLKERHYIPDAGMAKLPGTWMYGIPNIIRALSGNQYRGIAGSQDKALSDRMIDPNAPNTAKNLFNSQIRNQTRPTAPTRQNYSGGNPDATGSVNADADVSAAPLSSSDFINKVRLIESGGKPDAITGSYRGHFQFGKEEEKRYGIDDSNWKDPKVSEEAFKKHMAWLYPQLEKKLGRAPTPGELYLAHQQGVAGGPALLANQDKPAWEAIRPYYNSDYMAKLAISGNIPKSSPLKKIPVEQVMAGDFAKQWTSRFDGAAPSGPKIAGQPELPGRMNLGGPKPEGELQPTNQPLGDQYAQAPAFPSQPVRPQQAMPVPPAGPLETDAQLQARLRAAPAGQRQQIMEDYLKRAQGREFETTTGKGVVTPGRNGEQPTVSHTPNKTFPLSIGGMGLTMVPRPDGKIDLMLPGGETKGFETVTELFKYVKDLEAQGSAITKIGEAQTEPITEAIARANTANERGQTLRTMEGIAKSSNDISMGPTSPVFNELKRLIANFTGHTKGIAEADTIEKLSSILASESTKAISANRGTNFELQTFTRANPNLLQSKDGMLMMIDILKQEIEQQAKLGKIANSYRGKDPASWKDRKEEFYRDNPITTKLPMPDGSFRNLTTKRIETEEDLKDIPSGTYFITPSGKLGRKP